MIGQGSQARLAHAQLYDLTGHSSCFGVRSFLLFIIADLIFKSFKPPIGNFPHDDLILKNVNLRTFSETSNDGKDKPVVSSK